jgi:hypothetical protein
LFGLWFFIVILNNHGNHKNHMRIKAQRQRGYGTAPTGVVWFMVQVASPAHLNQREGRANG